MRTFCFRLLKAARTGRRRIEDRLGPGEPKRVVLASVLGVPCVGYELSAASPTGLPEPDRTIQAAPADSTNLIRSFLGRGVIREVPATGQTLIIRHEAIPGFMPKMTMEFTVRDKDELRGLRAGDPVTFRVRANEEESWIEEVKLAGTNEPPLPLVEPLGALAQIAKLKPGDLLPDAELVAEDGRTIRFSQFEGRAVAYTFIFTRCPLPDFCPRMSHHFSQARELLLQIPGGPTNWQFVSISFDPEFDTPGVLARYAENFRGQNADRWLFAAAPTNVLASMTSELDFRFANNEGSLVHNLRTVVLDPLRRVYRQFNGNQWKAEELAQALAEATRSTQ
jgi:protein SCO1/2